MEHKLEETTITTKPGESVMDAIARKLGANVVPVVVQPVNNYNLDWGRKRVKVSYRKRGM